MISVENGEKGWFVGYIGCKCDDQYDSIILLLLLLFLYIIIIIIIIYYYYYFISFQFNIFNSQFFFVEAYQELNFNLRKQSIFLKLKFNCDTFFFISHSIPHFPSTLLGLEVVVLPVSTILFVNNKLIEIHSFIQ